ncbi:CHAT domain-containing protein [Argonema galeatum]|uniref:nSTAND1 domain-containing NTPase n=1 Tax=Argonema galeatum TaxID=2942762 RepID=UPI002013B965|nr:CHAT domain-containing protein [Argonema galeatum]MCL1465722.1 CHAT domain-containing protein [Argonema galeatum A003/A1]
MKFIDQLWGVMGKLIRLEIQGEFNLGFSINAKIEEDSPLLSPSDNRLIAGITGKLADNLQLLEKYRDWQVIYRNIATSFSTFPLQRRPSFTNVSANIQDNDFEPFKRETDDLINSFNAWLKDKAFLPIESLLRNHLNPNEENRILLLTDNPWLRKLPWQEWDLIREFHKTEIGFASPNFKQVQQLSPISKDGVKILAILGYQADVESQGEAIQNLGKNVEVTWLKQPKREELDEPLWKQRWDIIFFVGHGESGDEWKTGTIKINQDDKITISELRNHLKKAIENGLKLAIFNCCDGLGLAHSLAEGEDLYLPQMIVMREELPVAVAPRFLQYFLEEFTQYNSLYASVREARRRLQILEKVFPCASNLPVICQNPAVKPLRWNDLVIPACPYRGLSAFQEEDAELFFGRESFTNHLVKVVEDKKLVAVIGASGSGKSSVVLAGLIPRLRQKENWLIASLRPGATPFENLAKALRLPEQLATDLQEGIRSFSDVLKSIGESRTVLLVVDQFEEIYSYPNQKFLDCLLSAVRDVSAFRLVLTLRADFLGQAIDYNPLREELQRWKSEFIGAMERQQLQTVIEEPAKKRGVYLEAGLTEHILNDVGNEPGYLPLLEFALTEMWNKQENGWLTRQVYDDIGGVKNALRRHAERVYDELEKADRERVKRIFLQLVSPEGTKYIRRLATRAEVGEGNWDLVSRLATARLVVSNRNETTEIETVEVVHEALIKAWPDLQKWIEEDDVFLRWKKRLQEALGEWERNENKEGYLLQVAPLGEAEGYLQQRLGDISPAERVFIQLGLGLRDRIRRRTILSLTSGLVAISIFATGAVWQWQRAERQSLISETDSLGNLALSQFQSGEGGINALMIAMEAGQKLKQLVKDGEPLANYPTTSPLLALQTITANIREKNEFQSDTKDINKAIFTPDGQKIVSFSRGERKVIIWNLSGQKITEWEEPENKEIYNLAMSPNGKYIVTVNENGNLYIWDFTGQKITHIYNTQSFGNPASDTVKFTPNSQYIAISNFLEVRFFNLLGKQVKELKTNTGGQITSIEFTANSEEIIIGNVMGMVEFWNLKSLKKIREFKVNTRLVKIAISPNGRQLLTLGADVNSSQIAGVTPQLWESSGKKIADFAFSPFIPGTNVHGDVSFSPNGQEIATVIPGEGLLKLYDTKSGKLTNTVTINPLFGLSLNYSSDGEIIAISGINGIRFLGVAKPYFKESAIIYETEGFPFPSGGNRQKERVMNNLQFSADSKNILITYFQNEFLDIWNLQKNEVKRFDFRNSFAIMSPDGNLIIRVTKEGIQKFDLSGTLISEIKTNVSKEENVLNSLDKIKFGKSFSFSFDGNKIATIGNVDAGRNINKAFPLRLWNLSTKQVKPLKNDLSERVWRVVVSPDGKYILTIPQEAEPGKIWDNSGNLVDRLIDIEDIGEFSLDSKYLVTWSLERKRGKQLYLRNMKNNQVVKLDNQAMIMSVYLSPDSKLIATAGTDNFIKIWDMSGKIISKIKLEQSVGRLTFSPDSQQIGFLGNRNELSVWNIAGKQIAKYTVPEQGQGQIVFSPDDKYIATGGRKVFIWRNQNLNELLATGCDWLKEYLATRPEEKQKLKVCQEANNSQ